MYDRCTVRIMSKVLTKTSNCVDAGAHKGEILAHMLRFAPNGTHFAFEPLPDFAAKLRREFPDVGVFEVALSDTQGTAEFRNVVNNPAYSGLRERRYPSKNERIELIRVQTRRLDDLLPDGTRIDFIKADIEGAEFAMFSGATGTIRTYKPYIVFEFGLGGAAYYGIKPEMVYDLLVGQCGLRISLLQDWLVGREPLSRERLIEQFDRHLNYYFLAHP